MEDDKATGRKKINCVYKSVNQTYKSAHNSKVKIIDLTEKEQRILTSFHEFFHIEDQNDGIEKWKMFKKEKDGIERKV